MTKKDFKEWIDIIKYCIKNHKLNRENYLKPTIERFWKFKLISEMEFSSRAETGDILLFTRDNIGSKVQRMFTGSRFGIF